MIIFRRRLLYWLIKAYIKKWGKTIFLFFLFGLFLFFGLRYSYGTILPLLPIEQRVTIGIVGAYRLDSLPDDLLSYIALGLTSLDANGTVKPGIAHSWKIQDKGKKYVFSLRKDLYFTDGDKVTAQTISYNFADTKKTNKDPYTIVFEIKETYNPFLVRLSQPIVRQNLTGVGEYRVKRFKLNGEYVEHITLVSTIDPRKVRSYQFYSNEDALKTAYALGEIRNAIGLSSITFNNKSFDLFANTTVQKEVNTRRLITMFYNTQDAMLSSRELRSALTYALPDKFEQGERNRLPYPSSLWAVAPQHSYAQDIESSKILLKTSGVATQSGELVFTIKTLAKYEKTAKIIQETWQSLDIAAKIEVVDKVPNDFQIFLGDFLVPQDPDQYSLWHSDQPNNIARYRNQRIDKLLEDGRQMENPSIAQRKKIYADFQKYLLADAPAAFLYFPYEYTLTRK